MALVAAINPQESGGAASGWIAVSRRVGRQDRRESPRAVGAGRAAKGGIDVPILLLPVFVAVVVLATAGLGLAAMLASLAPALFYGGYALYLRRRPGVGASARERRVLAAMRRRLAEIAPEDAAASVRLFQMRLQQEISRSARHSLPLTLLALHLHRGRAQPQDRAFEVLEVLARLVRAEDCVCQLADAEYALYLPQTSPAGAAVVMRRLEQALEAFNPRFGMAYLEPGRSASAAAMIDFARRSHVRPPDEAGGPPGAAA